MSSAATASSPARERLARFLTWYGGHRETANRVLMSAFVASVVGSTAANLRPSRKKKSKPTASTTATATTSDAAAQDVDTSGGRGGRGKKKRGPRVDVDAAFFERLNRILAIVIPNARSKEASLLMLHSCFLVFRTALSLCVCPL